SSALAALIAVTFLVGALALAPAAEAARGSSSGSGGKKGGGSTSATLVVTPTPAQAYSTVRVSGCGYGAGENVQLSMWTSFAINSRAVVADGGGCFVMDWGLNQADTYTLKAATGARNTTVATLTFTVY